MKPSPDQIKRGLAASIALRDSGDPARGIKPISFTGNPTAHVEAILEAGMADVPNNRAELWQDVTRLIDEKPRLRFTLPPEARGG